MVSGHYESMIPTETDFVYPTYPVASGAAFHCWSNIELWRGRHPSIVVSGSSVVQNHQFSYSDAEHGDHDRIGDQGFKRDTHRAGV